VNAEANGKYPAGTQAYLYCKSSYNQLLVPPYAVCTAAGVWNTDSSCLSADADNITEPVQIGPNSGVSVDEDCL